MNKRYVFIAEIVFAGALVGLLIGPESLDQFFGLTYENSTFFNVMSGAIIGGVLGALGASLPQEETE